MEESRYQYIKHCQHILENLQTILRDDDMLLDLTIVCSDGGHIKSSSALLTTVSPLLREVLHQYSEDEQYIMMPDIPSSYVVCFLTKLVEWHAMPSKFDLHMMCSVLQVLGAHYDANVPQVTHAEPERPKTETVGDIVTEVTYEVVTASQDLNKENLKVLDSSKEKSLQTVKTIYRCDKCMKQFRVKRDFLNHINAHLGIKPYSCDVCGKSFTQKSHLNTHMSIHSGAKKYICYKCGRAFNVSSNLKKHLAVHYRDQGEPEFQDEVEENLSPEDYLIPESAKIEEVHHEGEENNIIVAHNEGAQNVIIQQDEGTNNIQDKSIMIRPEDGDLDMVHDHVTLSQHTGFLQTELVMAQQHGSSVPQVCDESYIHIVPVIKQVDLQADLQQVVDNTQYNSQHHFLVKQDSDQQQQQLDDSHNITGYRTHEFTPGNSELAVKSGQNKYHCSFCVKSFKQKSHLNHHVRVKHLKGEHLEKFSCKDCDKKFTSTSSLKAHVMLHKNERPHECNHCGKTFVQISHLKIHMSKHLGDKPYLCVVCGKSFAAKGRLTEHSKIHRGERKVFHCSECPAKYFGAHDLQVHMRKHTGEFPFQCSHCPKQFRSHRIRDNHERIHTGERPYQCRGCLKGYGSCSSLHQHYSKSVDCRTVALQSHSGLYSKQEQQQRSGQTMAVPPHPVPTT